MSFKNLSFIEHWLGNDDDNKITMRWKGENVEPGRLRENQFAEHTEAIRNGMAFPSGSVIITEWLKTTSTTSTPYRSFFRASLVARWWRTHLPMQKTRVQSLVWEDPLEKVMETHSSILAWRTPRTEEPGGLWSMGSQRVGHDLLTKQQQQRNGIIMAEKLTYWQRAVQKFSECRRKKNKDGNRWKWRCGHWSPWRQSWTRSMGLQFFCSSSSWN